MPSQKKGSDKKRNSHFAFKAQVRRLVKVCAKDDVFDMFAGDGEMYRSHWHLAGRGATCDAEKQCVAQAAIERKTWTTVQTSVEKALRGGIWSNRPFSIIDVDCYGSPWKFVAALFFVQRKLSLPCTMILTDHYMANRNLSHEDKTLGFSKPGTAEDYLRCVDRLLKKTLVSQKLRYERRLFRSGKAVQHLVTLTRARNTSGTV